MSVMAVAACQKQEIDQQFSEDEHATFTASVESFDSQTKTSMTPEKHVVWSQNDRLAIFQGSTLADEYKVTDESAGKTNGTFSIVSDGSSLNGDFSAGTELPCNVAFYPYADGLSLVGAALEDEGVAYRIDGVVLPAEQTYAEGSFANGAFPMAAVTETMADHNLKFKNVLGALKLQLKGTQVVKFIRVEGNNGEVLSGSASVTAYPDNSVPAISMTATDDASKSVTLNCGDGIQLSAAVPTSFLIALPPVVFTEGFTVTVTDSEGKTRALAAKVANTIHRSSILAMPEVELDVLEDVAPATIDYIDEYGVNHGPGVEIDGIVWAPVNCGYHATDFQYGKLYQWGRMYGQGYSGALYGYDGEIVGEYSDSSTPEIVDGPVEERVGQSMFNADKFYSDAIEAGRWLDHNDYYLWNSGTSTAPIKADYDPCPDGWRTPTHVELGKLCANRSEWTVNENGQNGYWFSGEVSYARNVPQVFFSAAGVRGDLGSAGGRGKFGEYYASTGSNVYYYLYLYAGDAYVWNAPGFGSTGLSVRCVQDDSDLVLVESVALNKTSLNLHIGDREKLSATIFPSDASCQNINWSSDNAGVATVDAAGNVVAISAGVVRIMAMVGKKYQICTVSVNKGGDYVDEYGINHGSGVICDEVVWAPVNCGYHATNFKYGKLYQWGRKYGQGYDGEFYYGDEHLGVYSDAIVPEIIFGPVGLDVGQSEENANVLYGLSIDAYDWLRAGSRRLWNYGTEEIPIKSEYDPCPSGWRVPTYEELCELENLLWGLELSYNSGQIGLLSSRDAFFPAAGYLEMEEHNHEGTYAWRRGRGGFYWCSRSEEGVESDCLIFYGSDTNHNSVSFDLMSPANRGKAFSVRCVQIN